MKLSLVPISSAVPQCWKDSQTNLEGMLGRHSLLYLCFGVTSAGNEFQTVIYETYEGPEGWKSQP